jgi:hypothetical protein
VHFCICTSFWQKFALFFCLLIAQLNAQELLCSKAIFFSFFPPRSSPRTHTPLQNPIRKTPKQTDSTAFIKEMKEFALALPGCVY